MTFTNAVRAQMQLAIRSRGALFGMVVNVLPWVFTVGITELARRAVGIREIGPDLLIGPAAGMVLLAIGIVWGIVAWRDEPPRTRFYHWGMPMDIAWHDLARVVACLIWLLAGMTLYFIVGMGVMSLYDVPLRDVGWTPWLAPYAVGIIGYLLGAAYATAFERPAEYVLGTIMLVMGLLMISTLYQLEGLRSVISQVFGGPGAPYSLIAAATHNGIRGMSLYVDPAAHTGYLSQTTPILLWLVVAIVAVVGAAFYDRRSA